MLAAAIGCGLVMASNLAFGAESTLPFRPGAFAPSPAFNASTDADTLDLAERCSKLSAVELGHLPQKTIDMCRFAIDYAERYGTKAERAEWHARDAAEAEAKRAADEARARVPHNDPAGSFTDLCPAPAYRMTDDGCQPASRRR